MTALDVLATLALSAGAASNPQCLSGTSESVERAERREHFIGIARVINALQHEHEEATGTYLTREDVEGQRRLLKSQDGNFMIGGLVFNRPAAGGFEVRLTTDANSYTLSLKDTADPCRYTLFTDQSGIIYTAQPIR